MARAHRGVPGAVVGTLTAAAAETLGSPRSVKVVQGGADRAHRHDRSRCCATRPARAHHRVLRTCSWRHRGADPRAGRLGRLSRHRLSWPLHRRGRQTSTGSIINWLRRLRRHPDLAALNEKAAALEPGSDGLIVQDHFRGEPHPYNRPASPAGDRHGRWRTSRITPSGDDGGDRFRHARHPRRLPASAATLDREMTVGGGAHRLAPWMQIQRRHRRHPGACIPASPDAFLADRLRCPAAHGRRPLLPRSRRYRRDGPPRHQRGAPPARGPPPMPRFTSGYRALYPALKGALA